MKSHSACPSVIAIVGLSDFFKLWRALVTQTVKSLHALEETWVRSLGWDPLETGMATLSILVWEIPWTEEPSGLQSMGLQRVEHDLATKPPPQQ